MKKSSREALDAYYSEAGTWASDKNESLRKSATLAWIIATAAVALAVIEGIAIIVLTPLKTVVPYTLLVDRTTGFVQKLDPLDAERLTPDQALIQSMLVQYVIGRESFDLASLQADYRKIGLWSADQARTDYVNLMQASNPESPLSRYPRTSIIQTRVKSVSRLTAQSALVRFETTRRDQGGRPQGPEAWVAVVEYRFAGEPMSAEDRFLNPLGFQVVGYRRDAETLAAPVEVAAPSVEEIDVIDVATPGAAPATPIVGRSQ